MSLQSNGTSVLTVDAWTTNVAPDPLTEVSLRIDSLDLTLVEAQVGSDSVVPRLETMESHTMVVFSLGEPLLTNESVFLSVQLVSLDLQSNPEIDTSGSLLYRDLIFYLRPHDPVFDFTLITSLPVRGALSTASLVPLFPEPVRNGTDGQSLLFEWHVPYLQPGQEKVFIVQYSVPFTSVDPDGLTPLLYGLAIVTSLFSGMALVVAGPRMKQYLTQYRAVKYVGTTNEEQAIMDQLRKKGGSCPQKELYLSLDILESKMSLLLTSMEQRGLIRRFRNGREKMVYLVEE